MIGHHLIHVVFWSFKPDLRGQNIETLRLKELWSQLMNPLEKETLKNHLKYIHSALACTYKCKVQYNKRFIFVLLGCQELCFLKVIYRWRSIFSLKQLRPVSQYMVLILKCMPILYKFQLCNCSKIMTIQSAFHYSSYLQKF